MSYSHGHLEGMIEWAAAGRALPGEAVSGDEHLIKPVPHGVLAAVVDGLGHGEEATLAAQAAVNALGNHAGKSIISLVDICHDALRQTRGVVMTMAKINSQDNTITWMGIGNVEGILIREDPQSAPRYEYVLLRGGVVGYQLPTLSASILKIKPGDLLLLATDGIKSGFADQLPVREPVKQIADRILNQHFKGTDDALVLVVRCVGLRRE